MRLRAHNLKDNMDTQDAIMAREDELARAEELGLEDGPMLPDEGDAEPETVEIEHDGQVYAVPVALKGAFLRQADYTRKTQELADHRRAVEAERAALAEQMRSTGQAGSDRVRLAALDHQLDEFGEVDWQAFGAEDPEGAQRLWETYQRLGETRDRLAYAVHHNEERGRLQAAREAAERMAETGRVLQQEIEGWSPETARKLIDYAQAFGVTLEELAEVADPRLWKLLHKAYQAEEGAQREAATRAQAVRPAVLVSGAAGGGSGVRDELGTKEWMQRRNDQTRKGR